MRVASTHFLRLVALASAGMLAVGGVAPAAAWIRAAAVATDPDAAELALFERKAALSHDLGATQMAIADGLPVATWAIDPQDPYPAWFVHHAALLTMFPPEAMRPFVPADYAARVGRSVRARCAVLARYGMTAIWSANEPAVLPEPFFAAHPAYRGPRIDHAARSRKVYFAPDTDNPDVQRLYREAVGQLMAACPQVDTFLWVTTDAGSGFDWAPALYPGANGPSNARDRPLADRVVAFMTNVAGAAQAAAGHPVRVAITQIAPRAWMIPTFGPDVLANIVRQLPRGMAVNGKEGPDGRPFETGIVRAPVNPFYPVVGLVVPDFAPQPAPTGERRSFQFGDPEAVEATYRLLKATQGQPMDTATQRLAALRRYAAGEVGESKADDLIEAWRALDDARRYLDVLDFGGMLRFGHVLNRWIERPMVPFPLALTAEEKAGWRPFLFQARGEEQAADLVDIQAMRMFEGWGAHLLFQRDVELTRAQVERALRLIQGIAATATDSGKRDAWLLTGQRVQALLLLLQSADDMVAYQAHLDRVAALGTKPEANPVLGTQADWAARDMADLARREIDTTVGLRDLLAVSRGRLLDLAPTAAGEGIMRLGPDLPRLLDRKVATMNAHWRDYDRLFTVPNP